MPASDSNKKSMTAPSGVDRTATDRTASDPPFSPRVRRSGAFARSGATCATDRIAFGAPSQTMREGRPWQAPHTGVHGTLHPEHG